mmetsp:Transcript_2936/g.4983  ORF Transcript_2936/g.4983 Transcript_2936/m.4983 type:complete len:85 (+) Transcript_2936:179-433(+)
MAAKSNMNMSQNTKSKGYLSNSHENDHFSQIHLKKPRNSNQPQMLTRSNNEIGLKGQRTKSVSTFSQRFYTNNSALKLDHTSFI